jgi:hypothetical protein
MKGKESGVSCILRISGCVCCRVAANDVRVARFYKVFTTTTGQLGPNRVFLYHVCILTYMFAFCYCLSNGSLETISLRRELIG